MTGIIILRRQMTSVIILRLRASFFDRKISVNIANISHTLEKMLTYFTFGV